MLKVDDIAELACPQCLADLRLLGSPAGQDLHHGALACTGCDQRYRITDGLARLYRESQVTGSDRLMRLVYNSMAPWHNMAVRVLLPVFQQGTEDQFRSAYMPRLELDSLTPHPDGRPVRILEVGIGAGANLPLMRRALPPGLPVEIWGCDLSLSMLLTLRRDLRRRGEHDVRLMFADAHALPFPDHSFDRVFHVGGINGFRDPGLAMAEMGRVARPGTPVVVVDEHLDTTQNPNLYYRAMFKLVTWYDNDPHCPIELVPPGAVEVVQDQLSLFFFCLTYKMGDNRPAV